MFDFPEKGIERFIKMDDNLYYTEVIATGEPKTYQRHPKEKAKGLKILCLGAYKGEDDVYTYTIDIFNDGNYNENLHPKQPDMPREECLKRCGQALLRAYHGMLYKRAKEREKARQSEYECDNK